MGLGSLFGRAIMAMAAAFGLGGPGCKPPPQSMDFGIPGGLPIESWPGHYEPGSATGWTPPRGAYFARKGKARWKRLRRVRG